MTRACCYQVFTTMPTRAGAQKLGRLVVEQRLAACWQVVGPIRSIYRWKGKVESAREWLCLAKTSGAQLRALLRAIGEQHSYETPEIVALRIADGGAEYLAWVAAETAGGKAAKRPGGRAGK